MRGLHLIAELYDCAGDPRLLTEVEALRALCLEVCALPGLTPVGDFFYQFPGLMQPGGVTGAVVLAESHLTVHTWPEERAATLDLYVCNYRHDNGAVARLACQRLFDALQPTRFVRRELRRGWPAADLVRLGRRRAAEADVERVAAEARLPAPAIVPLRGWRKR